MRISPKQLLQGLLYLTPITLLALASCGGGGGGSSASLASYYTLSVNVTGISGVTGTSGVKLHNGGDDLNVTTPGTYQFAHPVLSGSTYNISVLSQPTPTQLCTFSSSTPPVHAMPASNTTVSLNCVPAFKIGGTISGLSSDGLVLQNNGGDNYQAASGVNGSFNFSTPVIDGTHYKVTVLTQPQNSAQTCGILGASGVVALNDVTTVAVSCTTYTQPAADRHVYAANADTSNVNAYKTSASGLSPVGTPATVISAPAAIAGDRGGNFVFVVNGTSSGFVTSYKITPSGSTAGALTKANAVATGNTPAAIAVHPSGKFAYVLNKLSNTVSAYSIDPTTGTLAAIDTDSDTAGMQTSIKTGLTPVAIALDPVGAYAYVVNFGSTAAGICNHVSSSPSPIGCISAYHIDPTTGALSSRNANISNAFYIDTGIRPSAITVDPSGKNVYVTNLGDGANFPTISVYAVNSSGQLNDTGFTTSLPSGSGPQSIALYPSGSYAYVANSSAALGSGLTVFTRNSTTGALSLPVSYSTGTQPVSVSVDSSGHYVYVANYGSNDISAYSIGGKPLTELPLSPINAGTHPVGVITSP